MKLINILAILTIFCIVLSASIVCASEDVESAPAGDTSDAANTDDSADDTSEAEENGENTEEDVQPIVDEENQGNWTEYDSNVTDGNNTDFTNSTTNNTINKTMNTTENATGNITPVQRAINSLVTGNPIIILLIALAAIGGYGIIKRK